MIANASQSNFSSSSTAAGTTDIAQSLTLGTQPTAVERQQVLDLQEQFQQQAQKDPAGFRLALREAFGDKASLAQIDQLLDLALAGKLPMPSTIQFVDAGSLGSDAFGAYDSGNGGSLYLDRSLLSDPAKLQSVFNEEMGHHLDALLGGADAAGDEGAVFSRTLEEGKLSQIELTALKSENDHGVIQIEGRWVQVEFNEEGGDESGGGGDESGGGDSGSSDSGGGAESGGGADSGGGGECSVDSGGGDAGGAGESQSESNTDSGDTDSGDAGGECSVGGDDGSGGTQGTDEPDESDEPDTNPDDHVNGESDSDRAGGPPGTGDGGPPDIGDDGPPGGDNRDDDTGDGGNEPPSEEDTESALTGLGHAGTGIGVLEGLNQRAGQGPLPDDIKNLNRGVGAGMRALGTVGTVLDPVVAFEHDRRRAESEGADRGEQIVEGMRGAMKRADNVAAAVGGTAVGGFSGNPFVAAGAGAGASELYGGSPMDEGFDEAVDAFVDGAQSAPTRVPPPDVSPGGTVNQGWNMFNRTR